MSGIPNTVKYIFSKALKPPLYKIYITHSMYRKIFKPFPFNVWM